MDYYNKYLKYKNKYYNIIKGGTATPGPFDIKEEYYPLSTNSFLYKNLVHDHMAHLPKSFDNS